MVCWQNFQSGLHSGVQKFQQSSTSFAVDQSSRELCYICEIMNSGKLSSPLRLSLDAFSGINSEVVEECKAIGNRGCCAKDE